MRLPHSPQNADGPLVLAHRLRDVAELNAEIRGQLKAQGHLERAEIDFAAGEQRPRTDILARDEGEIVSRAIAALQRIEAAIETHPDSGQARRLVKFLAAVYNGEDYRFDLGELRALDTELANACLDYLNYDRLGKREVHKHLKNGDRDLHRWLECYDLLPHDS